MTVQTASMDTAFLEKVLAKLGFSMAPATDMDGLEAVYSAWCQRVPFDNVMKLIHVKENNPAPLPGDTATQFFHNWMNHGTGGTCWAGNGALFALLKALGFDVQRGVATMLVAPQLPPNHATVIACLDKQKYMLDASILTCTPIKLDPQIKQHDYLPLWAKNVRIEDGKFIIHWLPMYIKNGLDCRLDYEGASEEEFKERHEQTRAWSPFNYELNIRQVSGDETKGIGRGKNTRLKNNGEYFEKEIADNNE